MLGRVQPLVDPFGRTLTYLRLSIIDRCNLRCLYCMPDERVPKLPRHAVLRIEEIIEVGGVAATLGITKLRITGGEPLIKRGVVKIVRELAALDGIRTVALTTNGQRLAKYAEVLASAGLRRVNVSLDTLDSDQYRDITRGGDIRQVLLGIDAALGVGLPVKINAVLGETVSIEVIDRWIDFAAEKQVVLRFVERMGFEKEVPYTGEAALHALMARHHRLSPLEARPDSPHVHRFDCDGVEVGFISPRSGRFCSDCNKLRLTAQGRLQACLAADVHVDLRAVLRKPHTADTIREAFRRVASAKPAAGPWTVPGTMWQVGG